eukprot:Hpha_TRINITY_DN16393_c3_g3::TRINITY_DN16393_c3_g3_i1::g.60129::m.60129
MSREAAGFPERPTADGAVVDPKAAKLRGTFTLDFEGVLLDAVQELGGSAESWKMSARKKPGESPVYFVAKKRLNPAQCRYEKNVNDLYALFGCGVFAPRSWVHEDPQGTTYLIQEWIYGETLMAIRKGKDREKYELARKAVAAGVTLDMVFANWDVVGAAGDNLLVDGEGNVYRIDNAGALVYRARGEKKKEWRKGNDGRDEKGDELVSEHKSFRQGRLNKSCVEVFHDVPDKDLLQQLDRIESEEFSRHLELLGEADREIVRQRAISLRRQLEAAAAEPRAAAAEPRAAAEEPAAAEPAKEWQFYKRTLDQWVNFSAQDNAKIEASRMTGSLTTTLSFCPVVTYTFTFAADGNTALQENDKTGYPHQCRRVTRADPAHPRAP